MADGTFGGWTTKVLGVVSLLALAACSADASPADDGSRSASENSKANLPSGGDGGTAAAAGDAATTEPVPPCDESEMAAVQTALDGSHPEKTDAVAAVKTRSCGTRFFTSGPAKHDETILHRIASVSKTYTGSVVLKLVEQGLVSLDDPASKWLNGIPGGEAVHVRHLLQHMSGLAAPSVSATSKTTPGELLSSSFKKGSQFTPGSKFDYQNVNFTALGVIAEKVTGKTLPVLQRELIVTPLGLKSTFFEGGETVTGQIAPAENGAGKKGNYAVSSSFTWAAGSMATSPKDLATWIEAFGSGSFFDAKLVPEIRKGVNMGAEGYSYGLATFVLEPSQSFGGGTGYGHFGDLISGDLFNGNCGYHTGAFYFPDHETTVVTIIDYSPSDLKTAHDVFNAVVKALFSPK